jgi:hypothetical protein
MHQSHTFLRYPNKTKTQLFAMRVQYTRERSAGLYSTFAYWLAGALVNLPLGPYATYRR